MVVEVLDADFTEVPVKDGIKEESAFVNDKDAGKMNQESGNQGFDEVIKFGSYETEKSVKGEGDAITNTNFPKDAVEEWPAPKQIHSFYFVKVRSHEDPKLKTKIDQIDKEIQRKNQARFEIVGAIKAKKSQRADVLSQLRPLTQENRRYKMAVDDKRKEMEPLHEALGKLRGSKNANGERGVSLCSSEEELNNVIKSLQKRQQHESNTLSEEKQLLKEIKQLEGTRDKVIANAAMKAKIQEALGPKQDIQDQVKLIGLDLDGVRKEKQAVRGKITLLEDELKTIDDEIKSLNQELEAISQKRDEMSASRSQLLNQYNAVNACFYKNRKLLNDARVLAAKKDVAALEELSHAEVEEFMSLWSSDKALRDDYEKRVLLSLDMRQLSRDGRMRNPDEKPLVTVASAPAPAEPEMVAKSYTKRAKEDSKLSVQHETAHIRKVQKEDVSKLTEKEISKNGSESEDKENNIIPEKTRKDASATNVVDSTKLKEMKREEEIAKAKVALDRKKKLAEKAAAKAAIRAEKEAEKKLKDREKKAKKKAAASAPATNAEELTESNVEAVEPHNTNVSVETPVPSKKEKENTVRYRSRGKVQDSLPKVLLKRKKSTPYWVWAAAGAAVAVVPAVIIGYNYLL